MATSRHRHRRPDPAPRAHWFLLISVLAAVVGLLALHAVVLGGFHSDETAPQSTTASVPDSVRTGGSLIDARNGAPVVRRPTDKTLALTFDDGPDPTWTPAILAVLDRYHVKATFFVTGAHAAEYPGLVRDIAAHGHDIGNHTATHVDLRTVGDLRTQLELRFTDLAVAGAAGVSPALVRPPYSATPASVDDPAWRSIQRIGAAGKFAVLSDTDSEDWQRPGAAAVVANSTPKDDRGTVLLMHDAGGDRSQTVAALDRLIPALQAQGWRLGTVSDAVGLASAGAPAGLGQIAAGWLLIGAVQASNVVADLLVALLIVASVLAALRTVVMLITTTVHVRRRRRTKLRPVTAPATVIIPAYNERAGIEATIRSVLASDHRVTVIVVDDGSTDGTAELVEKYVSRRVRLTRQANAGKAAALNTGIAAARTELVVLVDGDTVLEPGTVRTLVQHFADPGVGAVSGNAKVGNRRSLLGQWQHIEYVIGFNLDRRLYDVLECMPTVPGAIGAFRRSAVMRLGGIPVDTLAEDTDLTMAMERDGWRVVYEQEARAWTEAPATLGQLWKQRYRWCYGTLQAVWKHRRAVLERGAAGRLGRRGLPYLLLFQVLLPVLAPLVDAAALFGILTSDWLTVGGYWLIFLALQAIPAVIAFRLDGERVRSLLLLPLQQFVYRQLMYLVVVQSVVTALAGAPLPWHKLHRTGLTIDTANPSGRS
ncbi:bifunctional polysaccharide deacetylase/glycosyltransferase family 2 protein [Amycolatopsis carbonis]|uniref:Bifunctional polysaccharide deacetylase/glycosyltransferase family 2 protein n=1 Tax=Amycolatopsis carbonis TaxID=715471 RepID=A0A9Y2MRI0_9PSEU|nr:bifunctional polysaccharide deacetylase/glycosyltransferase family 2 protein [Amycolatopsis sp. 2-15]WIX75491.1 bifunctional polysaccharide deacetylase/glycosyltransferase family 2 protein [Amycolatopsis sp. 2-15]